MKQARKFCVDCCCGSIKSIRLCCDVDCPLWFLRFGTFPATYVRRNGKEYVQLFDKENFKAGARYDSAQCVEEMRL